MSIPFILQAIYQETHSKKCLLGSAWRMESRVKTYSEIISKWFNSRNSFQPVRLLDIGGRDGTFLEQLTIPCSTTVLDIDSMALLQYRMKFRSGIALLADCNDNLPIDSCSYDIVMAGEFIEHILSPDSFLSEICRVIKDGGLFVGSTPNAFRWDKRIRLFFGYDPKIFSDTTHTQYFSYDSLTALLNKNFPRVRIYIHPRNILAKCFPKLFADGFIWEIQK
jgi:2-polyprenyl-3-methyl-5-hydroxy-6-metoxy-1,4-benzoquinol methylase